MIANPYAAALGGREPISAMRDTVGRIAALLSNWTPAQYERRAAPGKWTVRQIVIHLAQSELAFGNRARMALATPSYTSQAFDQNVWMSKEETSGATGPDALAALVSMNAFNRGLFGALSAAERETPFTHPEYGPLTINWLIEQMAGHLSHHLVQLEGIAKQ